MGGRVLGVDACRTGWIGVVAGGPAGAAVQAYFGTGIADLVAAARADGPLAAIAIDIPIGLPDRGRREADVLARGALGRRRSSLFYTPVRAALECASHAQAVAVSRDRAGEGVSAQAYGLRAKILDVDGWVATAPVPVVEGHPELSFAVMGSGPLRHAKKTWAGAVARWGLLADAGIELAGGLGVAGAGAAVDDVLDAAAMAWTARRLVAGHAISRPDPPQVFDDGWPAAIWT